MTRSIALLLIAALACCTSSRDSASHGDDSTATPPVEIVERDSGAAAPPPAGDRPCRGGLIDSKELRADPRCLASLAESPVTNIAYGALELAAEPSSVKARSGDKVSFIVEMRNASSAPLELTFEPNAHDIFGDPRPYPPPFVIRIWNIKVHQIDRSTVTLKRLLQPRPPEKGIRATLEPGGKVVAKLSVNTEGVDFPPVKATRLFPKRSSIKAGAASLRPRQYLLKITPPLLGLTDEVEPATVKLRIIE